MARKNKAAPVAPTGPRVDVWTNGDQPDMAGVTIAEAAKVAMLDPAEVEWAIEVGGRADTDTHMIVPAGSPKPTPLATRVKRSVVGDRYKARYRAAGNYRGCGDWLHRELEALTVNGEGKLDLPAFEAIAAENGVSLEKYNRTTNGWQGRLRMTGRVLLRTVIRKSGALLVDGKRREAPAEWMAANAR